MADNRNEFVVSHEEGWAVQPEGADQPTKVFDNKQDAIDRAKEIAQNKGTTAVIHKKDGTVQNQFSYSEDNSQGNSGGKRSEETNKEYGRQGKYAKGNKN
ncbi:DUF2188 domain-containing protein [Halobacillus yeomjeoni]|uniref:DUF2188 domain-containing protein n=1 Tax=Halobacillus yeomjeoni TaxID=311194 RepID=UPI001CD71730|nr:DUF2188 domain-containing protein [Halobacillus yeomjeoni]MCA0984150.1 DUF2188 domain-containing protein [Halobacillus yeomjeoni]